MGAFFRNGSVRLFRVAGIDVYLNFTWLIAAYYFVNFHAGLEVALWGLAQYVTLFAIVLLHEFGHAFACRSVGGTSKEIMLWPLGGIAFAAPPARPGAVMWTIAAGPLVNVALAPILWGAFAFAEYSGLAHSNRNLHEYLAAVAGLNTMLLLFNIMPIYPLDGGQVLQSVFWFMFGRARSLQISGWMGMIAWALILVPAYLSGDWLLPCVAVFLGFQSWIGLRTGNYLQQLGQLPRRDDLHCPSCGEAPVVGTYWVCADCDQSYDVFASHGLCPHCGRQVREAACPFCGRKSAISLPAASVEFAQAAMP